MASKSQKKKITFFHDILKEDEKIVNSYNKRGYYYEVIVKEPTFWDKIKKYNNDDKPYYINKLDQLTYKLCPACKPDEFEEYHMKHDTPGYQFRCVLDCICGREATLDNILHGCSHCTCIDESTRNKLYISEIKKINTKLKNDQLIWNPTNT